MTREEFEKRARYETDIFGGAEESTYALWGALWAYDELMKEVQPLVEALEFYADPNNWARTVAGHGDSTQDQIKNDGGWDGPAGRRARQALETFYKVRG